VSPPDKNIVSQMHPKYNHRPGRIYTPKILSQKILIEYYNCIFVLGGNMKYLKYIILVIVIAAAFFFGYSNRVPQTEAINSTSQVATPTIDIASPTAPATASPTTGTAQ